MSVYIRLSFYDDLNTNAHIGATDTQAKDRMVIAEAFSVVYYSHRNHTHTPNICCLIYTILDCLSAATMAAPTGKH